MIPREPMPEMIKFGERLEKARLAAGLTRKDLEKKSGVSYKTILEVERGFDPSEIVKTKLVWVLPGLPFTVDQGAFGVILRMARLRAGMSQEVLGEQIGCSFYTISQLERGVQKPSDVLKAKLEEVFPPLVGGVAYPPTKIIRAAKSPPDEALVLGLAVKMLRTELGLSQTAFAKECGISRKIISRLEISAMHIRGTDLDAVREGFMRLSAHLKGKG